MPDDKIDWLKIAEDLNEPLSNLTALLEGQVSQLKANGWSDEQARGIIYKMVMGQ